MSFAEQISSFAVKAIGLSQEGCRKIALEIYGKIDLNTPVDEGTLRFNWQGGAGSPPSGTLSGEGSAASRILGDVKAWVPYDGNPFWIVNNLIYAPVIEYGLYPNPPKKGKGKTINGYSTQAPAGMVGIVVAEYGGTFNGFGGEG